MNERHLCEQVLLTHPYFRLDDMGEPLDQVEKDHRINRLKEGFLINLKREKETTMGEIHKAVGIIVEDLEKFNKYYYGNVLRLLEAEWVFKNGKCALYTRSKKERKATSDDAEEGKTCPASVRARIERWKRYQPTPEEQERRQKYFQMYPHTQMRCLLEDGSFSAPYRPGMGETP